MKHTKYKKTTNILDINKTKLLHDVKMFGQNTIEPQKCMLILSKILFMLNQDNAINAEDATLIFYAITKLFQSKDLALRRTMYLCLKELISFVTPDAFIMTSSLINDINSNNDLKSSALRVLAGISDGATYPAVERYIKQAIMDNNTAVKSAGLVSALHLSNVAPDSVKGLILEVQEVVSSAHPMVSYHAAGLLSNLNNQNKQSIKKLIIKLMKIQTTTCHYFLCHLIRLTAQQIKDNDEDTIYIQFIADHLEDNSDMVAYEAANVILNLNVENKLDLALNTVKKFCESFEPHLKLAGMRTLAGVISKIHKRALVVNIDDLVSDSNECVAKLAISTLLTNCSESSVTSLLEKISKFMKRKSISFSFKISIVGVVHKLCNKYPNKHQCLLNFLTELLQSECNLASKAAIVDTLIAFAEENEHAKEICMQNLCEIIEEDCEPSLAPRILYFIGREGPKSKDPLKYMRFIYNRLILDSCSVRAAAVSAIVLFGVNRPKLLPDIKSILNFCHMDDDDDVRDRAIYYGIMLDQNYHEIIHKIRVNHYPEEIEKALINDLQLYSKDKFDTAAMVIKNKSTRDVQEQSKSNNKQDIVNENIYHLSRIAGIDSIGKLYKTCEPIQLTEVETEYRVQCIKHVYAKNLVLQFQVLNTMTTQVLHNITVNLKIPINYKILSVIPCDKLFSDTPKNIFIMLEFPEDYFDSIGTFKASLHFLVQEYDKNNLSYEYTDEYCLEDIQIKGTDQLKYIHDANWVQLWDDTSLKELQETFTLPFEDTVEAAKAVCINFGLPNSVITGKTVKEICGVFTARDECSIILKSKMVNSSHGVVIQVIIKSPKNYLCQMMLNELL